MFCQEKRQKQYLSLHLQSKRPPQFESPAASPVNLFHVKWLAENAAKKNRKRKPICAHSHGKAISIESLHLHQ